MVAQARLNKVRYMRVKGGKSMKTKTLQSAYFSYALICALIGGVVGLLIATGRLEALSALKMFMGFFSLSFLIAMPLLLIWWKRVDEAVKEAHKWAWFWGGSIGMMLAIWVLTLNVFVEGRLFAGMLAEWHLEAYGLELGAVGTLLVMSYSYIFAWAFWWWKRR
jgi:hypothetical protein